MQTLPQMSTWHDVSALDYMPLDRLRDLQLVRLQTLVRRVYDNVPCYRARMDEAGVRPDDIRAIENIARLPFTYKTDLRDNYPFGLFAVPMERIVRLHASSGTTGKPIVVAYTQNDIHIWSQVMLRSLVAGGVSSRDMVQNAYGYGLFTGGLGVHYGAEALGATVVPISGGNTERQILIMKDFGVTVITCTPSYFLHLIDKAEEMGVDMRTLKLRAGIFGAEPWSEPMRKAIEQRSGIEAFDIYGLSEIIGPGVSMECSVHQGLHVFEDHFLAEIIDPDSGEVLPDGQEGEIVFTTLTKEAFPVLRYRTRDISRLHREKCECGRTIVRMERVRRRSDDMFIIRGINVFPSQVETALLAVEGTLPHYQIVLTREIGRASCRERV
jgi:phenylacetate-CoA ligase